MFKPEDMKEVYERNYNTCMNLVNANTQAVKEYMTFQTELVEDFLKESNSSLSSLSSIKSPQDLEKYIKDSQSKLEQKASVQSKKYLELCQNYQKQMGSVVDQFSNNSAELVKKVKKS